MKIGVFGAGSIGCYVGGRLALGGADVVFIGRPRFGDMIKAHGLKMSDLYDWRGKISGEDVDYQTSPAALRDADIVLVCVKSNDTQSAADALRPILKDGAVVISLQNGVSNTQTLAETLSEQTILAGMVPYNVALLDDYRFHQGTAGRIHLEDDNATQALEPHFERTRLGLKLEADMPSILWGKLVVNLNNAINALSGLPLKAQLEQRDFRRCVALCQKEALSVLKQQGQIVPAQVTRLKPDQFPVVLSLPNWIFKKLASQMLAIDPLARSSMADDLTAGRPPEVQWINGEITMLAEKIGTKAPINARVIQLIEQLFAANKPKFWSGCDLFKELQGAH